MHTYMWHIGVYVHEATDVEFAAVYCVYMSVYRWYICVYVGIYAYM